MDGTKLLERDAVRILQQCAENIPWDDEDQEENFQFNLEREPEKAWEDLAYYWWADYSAPADWWCSMSEAAMKLMNDRKRDYAMMRMNHLTVARAGHAQANRGITIHPFPTVQPEPEDGIGEYLVWMENEYKAGWGLRIWHDLRRGPGERVSNEAPNGAWSGDAFDAPVLYWAEKPGPPRGHSTKSMGVPE